MPEPKTNCKKCGKEILQTTAARNNGLCCPCQGNDDVVRKLPELEMEPGRHVDWMCILLKKDAETDSHADYFFSSTVSDKDPRFKNRHMQVGSNVGLLRISKATGESQLLYPMAEDDGERRYMRAASAVRRHWKAGEFPDKTAHVCG